jgi:aminoglycoside phosphotransferase (APT) family kinase protein
MYVISFVDAHEQRRRAVLRRVPDWDSGASEQAEREVQTMRVAADAGVPVPEVLLLDSSGALLGSSAILMSYAGRPVFEPSDLDRWFHGFAEAMHLVHRVKPQTHDLSHLKAKGLGYISEKLSEGIELKQEDPLTKEGIEVLRQRLEDIEWLPPCLVHFDFWPGNVLWHRNKVSAIIDWSSARSGDPRFDVAQCRLDIALLMGVEAADRFLDAYNAGLPGPLHHLWFFDLFLGLRAMAHYEDWWMPAYHDMRLPLTSEIVAQRAREFVQAALGQAKAT